MTQARQSAARPAPGHRGPEALLLVCLLAVGGVVLPACEQEGSTGTVSRGGGDTAGGEDEGDEQRGELERPPGSREPDEGVDDDDLEGGETPGTPAGGEASATPQESPWGAPEGESGE
ncbi:MAG: hypothetical protein M3Y87_27740, partial [Myxococcota bacterium]|nr:hypothetical protein [Myxococcota bacterium]